VTAEQTAAFGDYLNDLEMLGAAHWSYAMADAHPRSRPSRGSGRPRMRMPGC
jgi:hydroxymethylpyrimidine pyrophosphatase-like HAD family hydrolase